MLPPDKKPSPKEKRAKDAQAYLKYSGMAFQMAVIIGLGLFAGKKVDQWLETDKPYFTMLFALLAAVAAFYITLKDILIKKK